MNYDILARQAPTPDALAHMPMALLDHCHNGILIIALDGHIIGANQAFIRMLGDSKAATLDSTLKILSIDGKNDVARQKIWNMLRAHGHWSGEIWNRRKNGEVYPEWLSISAVRDARGETTNFIGIFTDISDGKQMQKIQQLAFYDQLTGLPNRSLLEDRINLILANTSRSRQKSALLCIDLDQFKSINDSLGHAVGDLLLREVAERLKQCVREGDTVARLGGDEFAIVLAALSHQHAEAMQAATVVAEKISSVLVTPFSVQDYKIVITPSIGIAISPDDAHVAGELLRKSDTAMYCAKNQGRNNYQFYTEQMNVAAQERLHIEHELRKAMENDAFELHYQPQIMSDGRMAGVEALLRWRNKRIAPDKTVAVAEEAGLIAALGFWVLREACRQMKSWEDTGLGEAIPRVSVNVSPRQFRQPDFVEAIMDILHQTGLSPRRLELELTEGCLVHNMETTSEKLKKLKAAGMRLSIDDFGTGYSSLSYLKHFPLDTLKIDRSFVQDIATDPNNTTITTTIILMSHSLGLGVIAEGVESELQLEFLKNHGCHCYQGFLFSQALPATELVPWISQHHTQWCSRIEEVADDLMPSPT